MARCRARTAKGSRCPLDVLSENLCHVHHPEATYAQQHPQYRKKLMDRTDVIEAIAGDPSPLAVLRHELDFS